MLSSNEDYSLEDYFRSGSHQQQPSTRMITLEKHLETLLTSFSHIISFIFHQNHIAFQQAFISILATIERVS